MPEGQSCQPNGSLKSNINSCDLKFKYFIPFKRLHYVVTVVCSYQAYL